MICHAAAMEAVAARINDGMMTNGGGTTMIDMASALATILSMRSTTPASPPQADPTRAASPEGYQPPVPIGGDLTWLSRISYPMGARRRQEGGRVIVTLTISYDGKPVGCAVISSSGLSDLDTAVCDGAKKYGRFRPALQNGRPIVSLYEPHPVVWRPAPGMTGRNQ